MNTHSSFQSGVIAGMLLMLGAQALHWFIAPGAHPDASQLRHVGVALQAAIRLRRRCLARLVGPPRENVTVSRRLTTSVVQGARRCRISVIPHALPAAPIAGKVVDRVGVGLALHQLVASRHPSVSWP